jgi:hypothetical protein
MALTGLWDSMFSRKYGAVWRRWPRRFWARIGLVVGPPIPPERAELPALREAVVTLRGSNR